MLFVKHPALPPCIADGHYKNLLYYYYYLLEGAATAFRGGPYLFLFLIGLPGLADLLLPLLQLPLLPLTLVLALVFHNLLGLPHTHITHTVLGPDTVSVHMSLLGPNTSQGTGS